MYLPDKFRNPIKLQKELKTKPESYWIKRGEKMALRLFHDMAHRVPAYKDFLKKNKFNPDSVKTINDFKNIPLISKDNYLRKYPLGKLCWDGEFVKQQWDISSTSGSTGEPFYFPRTDLQNKQYAVLAELYLLENFQINKKTTLYINCFALGVWIGGIFTYEALKIVSKNNDYALSIINPGLNKPEIFKILKKFAKLYDQVIIGGYPPFVKDLIDEGKLERINFSKYNLKFVFSAESFTESFRDYIYKNTGKHNIYMDSLNHYGTVDQGTLAHETPLSIMLRRETTNNNKLYFDIFGDSVHILPTLTQYLPEIFYFEEVNKTVVCSSYSGLPLVRYDLKDNGGVISLNKMYKFFKNNKISVNKKIKEAKISKTIWNLPFVYVYERKDMSVSLSGANIYPQNIKKVLEYEEFSKFCTGKFTMIIKRDKKEDPYLEINIEIKHKSVKPTKIMATKIQKKIIESLLNENSEYKVIYDDRGFKKAAPRLVFWKYQTSDYFKSGGKLKWLIKNK